MKDEKIIARIARNSTDEAVVRIGNHWNIDILDIRWYKNGNPTHKGIRVNKDEAKILLGAIKKANKVLGDKYGLQERDEGQD